MKINFTPAEKFRGTQIFRQANNLAYAYETAFKAVDADGAPNAYNPEDTGLDALANAGYPHTSWWKEVLVPDPDHPSRAYVQTDGEFAGYFVAMTSLRHPHGEPTDPATYVDSTRFPYVVLPTGFTSLPHVARSGDTSRHRHHEHLHRGRLRRRQRCKTRRSFDRAFRGPWRAKPESKNRRRRPHRENSIYHFSGLGKARRGYLASIQP
jgi:hypothetical protein